MTAEGGKGLKAFRRSVELQLQRRFSLSAGQSSSVRGRVVGRCAGRLATRDGEKSIDT